MGLFDKVRILVGALVHKPFASRPEKADLDEAPEPKGATRPNSPDLVAEQEGLEDMDRVADLIAQRGRDEAD